MTTLPRWILLLGWSWTLLFWGGCIAVPLYTVLVEAFSHGGVFSFFDPAVLPIVKATLWQAVLSTGISSIAGLLLGLFIGEWIAAHPFSKLGHRIQTLLAIPYGVPSVVAAMAWIVWLGRSGFLMKVGIQTEWLYSMKAVILAHAFLNIPFVALLVSQARKHVSLDQLEMARTLGCSRFSEIQFIIWPAIKWALASATAQVMALCTMSFGLVLILGGGPPVQTLETQLYSHLRYGPLNIGGAAICGVWELILTLIPWVLVLYFQSKMKFPSRSHQKIQNRILPFRARRFQGVTIALVASVFVLPYFAIVDHAVLGRFWSLWQSEELTHAMGVSLGLALASAGVAVFAALMAVLCLRSLPQKKVLKTLCGTLFMVPSGVSILVLGLGFWQAYSNWIDPFDGSFLAMVALQSTLFFPLAYRIVWPLSESVASHQLEAAFSLGASGVRAFWLVEWPRWRHPVHASFAAVAGASLGELGAVSLFYSEKLVPLPVLISRWMHRYRFEEAQGIAFLLLILSVITISLSLELSHNHAKSH